MVGRGSGGESDKGMVRRGEGGDGRVDGEDGVGRGAMGG